MKDRLIKLFLGNTLASFAITCTIQAGLGCFPQTAANIAISNWLGISIGMAGFLVEIILLSIATYKGEGIGLTSIVNATYGSLLIDVFMAILPKNPFLIIGIILLPIAWSFMGSAGFGDTGSNTLMNAILKNTKLNISIVRGIQELLLLTTGFLGARAFISLFTIILMVGLGPLLQIAYKWLNFDPTAIKHSYIIKQRTKIN